jgi:hypothetical protein
LKCEGVRNSELRPIEKRALRRNLFRGHCAG